MTEPDDYIEAGRAQRWHDTDHGKDRPPPKKSNQFRKFILEPRRDWFSSCWCCCELCDPDWEPTRPNPYWSRATAEMKGRAS